MDQIPVLKGHRLFRENEMVYINRSNELEEYMGVVHTHDFIEIAYVFSGTGVHIVGDRKYEISPGDLFIINTDIPHGFFPKDGESVGPTVYNCVFTPQFLDLSLFSSNHFEDITTSFLFKSIFPEDFTPQPDLKLSNTAFSEIGDLFEKLYSEYKLKQKGYTDIIRAYLIEIIIKVFRYMDASKNNGRMHRNQLLIQKAIEYMKMNYNTEITLSELAMRSFISRNYFSKLFKDVTGSNVSDFIQYLRTEQACVLLKTTDMKVTDIASNVGFSDMKFFYNVFKKITGKTPGDYRKQKV